MESWNHRSNSKSWNKPLPVTLPKSEVIWTLSVTDQRQSTLFARWQFHWCTLLISERSSKRRRFAVDAKKTALSRREASLVRQLMKKRSDTPVQTRYWLLRSGAPPVKLTRAVRRKQFTRLKVAATRAIFSPIPPMTIYSGRWGFVRDAFIAVVTLGSLEP